MWIFLLILSIVLIIGGIICFVESDDSYDNYMLLFLGGFVGVLGGIILLGCSIVGICGGFDKKTEIPKEPTTIVSDSTQVPSDTIKSIMYVISYKDEDGVWCGQNVKLLGYTNKNIGDTIIVNLK